MTKYTRSYRNGIYRSRSGIILGVCTGLAQHFDFSVFWTRVIALILLFVAGFLPAIGLYLLAAVLMKPEPVIPIGNSAEKEFYDSYSDRLDSFICGRLLAGYRVVPAGSRADEARAGYSDREFGGKRIL